ncbi:MAG: hypothetical protein JRE47_14310 [Deltaproteobacteria bacterium]|nr:hypothetical protein [Deltaproteobacteria bacterium]
MDQVIQDSVKIIATLGNLFKREGIVPEFQVLSEGSCVIEVTGYDNWDGGTDIYGIFCKVPLDIYSRIEHEIQSIEQSIKQKAETLFRTYPQCWIGEVVVSPQLTNEIQGKVYKIPNDVLLKTIELQKNLMISVSTGGARIQNVNSEYQTRLPLIREGLSERNIKDVNPFNDLWEWYGKWSDGSLPSYQSRRSHMADMFNPVIESVKNMQSQPLNPVFDEPTGWMRVDRSLGEIKLRLVQASNEEQFQTVGLLGRETLISLAQVVYIEDEHPVRDGVKPSKTDAKRMIEAYISSVLPGKSNVNIRRHAKASLDLANDLTHRRTADFRLAALCAEATNAVVNIVAIISGRRDRA